MKRRAAPALSSVLLAVAALAAAPARAQQSPEPTPAPAPVAGHPLTAPQELTRPLAPRAADADVPTRDRSEPQVVHSVIEDGGSKIDQLTVRGQVQHVVVTPKIGPKQSYEILTAPDGRVPYYGTGGSGSATGNRVWNVLHF